MALYSGFVRSLTSLLGTVFLLWTAAPAPAYFKNYLPLKEHEISRRFQQRVIRSSFLPYNIEETYEVVRIGSTTVRFAHPNKIQFSGTDVAGKRWIVTGGGMMGGALYSADLDHNGRTDIIYAAYTGGNGLAPPMHVLTLLFDATGRPVPSEMDGYFEIDERGLQDLIDLDGDGRAELIRQAYDDGYWITSAYEARDAHWHRIRGEHASRGFPIYTRFTYRANRVPTTPAPGRHPEEDDLSNDAAAYSGRLAAVHWANVSQSEDPKLHLSDGTVCLPVAWYSSLVVISDTADGRKAATLGAPEEAHRLLNEIMRAKLAVEVKGHRRYRGDQKLKPTGCVPEAIWASAP
jgi:hypothetical protein